MTDPSRDPFCGRVQRPRRPLPTGGLEDVVRRGRLKRRRAVLGTSGAGAVAVAVVAGVLLLPGSHSDSLRPADPTPVVTRSATDTPTATASPTDQPSSAPSPSATPSGGPTTGQSTSYPAGILPVEDGRTTYYAVYVDVVRADDGGEPSPSGKAEVARSLARLEQAGYDQPYAGSMQCEGDAPRQLGLASGRSYTGVAVYFTTAARARQFVDAYPYGVVGTAHMMVTCGADGDVPSTPTP